MGFFRLRKALPKNNIEVLYDDTPITLKRTENCEDGNRYKQYKFKPAELAGMYGCDLQHAVALVSIYANNGSRTAKEVIETKYVVALLTVVGLLARRLSSGAGLIQKALRYSGISRQTTLKRSTTS